MNQKEQILEYLVTHNSITPIQALNRFGCFRLAARIGELKAEGQLIDMNMVTRTGGGRYASYSLIEPA